MLLKCYHNFAPSVHSFYSNKCTLLQYFVYNTKLLLFYLCAFQFNYIGIEMCISLKVCFINYTYFCRIYSLTFKIKIQFNIQVKSKAFKNCNVYRIIWGRINWSDLIEFVFNLRCISLIHDYRSRRYLRRSGRNSMTDFNGELAKLNVCQLARMCEPFTTFSLWLYIYPSHSN